MEAQGSIECLLEDEVGVHDSQCCQARVGQLEAFLGEREGGQQEEGNDCNQGEEVDVVKGPLQCNLKYCHLSPSWHLTRDVFTALHVHLS